MDFFSFAFFIKICDIGFEKTLKEFSLTYADMRNLLSTLGSFLGGDLFEDLNYPSMDNLTKTGKTFLNLSRKFVDDLLTGFLDNINLQDDKKTINIKSDILSSKNFILPIITDIENQKKYETFKLKLLSFDNDDRTTFNTGMHVIFDRLSGGGNLFYKKLWSVKIEQGLYASERYLHDTRSSSIEFPDLQNHSIVGIGDSFDLESYSRINWHLSEKYMGFSITPAVLVNSQSVMMAAIRADLGIGPIMHYQISECKDLVRILPDLDGPSILLSFAIRKKIPEIYQSCIDEIERNLLSMLQKFNLEIIYEKN